MILFHVFVLSFFVFCVENKTLRNISQDYNDTDHGVNGKTMNSMCFESQECIGKLVCLAGECQCCEQHIWNGSDCIIRKTVNSTCRTSQECYGKLVCIKGNCHCSEQLYWDGTHCIIKITVNEACDSSLDCFGKLFCLNGKCQCPPGYFWHNDHCSLMDIISTPCTDNSGCYRNLYCIHGTCQCAGEDYWTSNMCSPRKTVNSTCRTSQECYGKLVCIEGTCQCSEQLYWDGTNCIMINIIGRSCDINIQCGGTFFCNHGKCQCAREDYWNGHMCSRRKPINAKCEGSPECEETLICINGNCQCPSDDLCWNGNQCVLRSKECEDITATDDGVYTIYPNACDEPVPVYCIMEHNKKWTVIQRRVNGYVDFNRTWKDYKIGFGSPYGEYWLGNELIHSISTDGHHELSIYMATSTKHQTANYSTFSVGNEKSKYLLTVTEFSGDEGDNMDRCVDYPVRRAANGQKFSTKDQDNDRYSGHCAESYKGGWWYNACTCADFNRLYSSGMFWTSWSTSIKKSIMMIKRTQ